MPEQVAEMRADMRHLLGNVEQFNRSLNSTRDELGRKLDEVIKPLAIELREQGQEINTLRDRISQLETTVSYLKLIVFGFVGVVLMGFAGALVSLTQLKPEGLP